MELNGEVGLVGGAWLPDCPGQAFKQLDESFDNAKIRKSSQMLEALLWDPCGAKKCPLSACSLTIEHDFSGTGAAFRGSLYMIETIGKILECDSGTVKGLVFDNACNHLMMRQILFGQETGVEEELQNMPWFSKLSFRPLPSHCLPRLPLKIALCDGEPFFCIAGVCPLATKRLKRFGRVWYSLERFGYLIFIYFYLIDILFMFGNFSTVIWFGLVWLVWFGKDG